MLIMMYIIVVKDTFDFSHIPVVAYDVFCFYNEDFYHHCGLKYKDMLNVIRVGDFEEVFTAV